MLTGHTFAILAATALFAFGAGVVAHDVYLAERLRQRPAPVAATARRAPHWRTTVALLAMAWIPLLVTLGVLHWM